MRNTDEGISIRNDANVNYRIDNNFGGSEELNLSWRKGKLELINDASWTRHVMGEDNKGSLEYVYMTEQKVKDEMTADNIDENFAMDYAINDSCSVGAKYNFMKRTKGDIKLDGSYSRWERWAWTSTVPTCSRRTPKKALCGRQAKNLKTRLSLPPP